MPPTPPMTRAELTAAHCRPLEGESGMSDDAIAAQLEALPEWRRDGGRIHRALRFADYWETTAFVAALAWVIHREDHHPELTVRYDAIDVRFDTHSVGGISLNDFICAAKCDALYAERPRAASA